MFYSHLTGLERDIMKKLGFIAAAIVALAVAAPSVASAEKIVIKRGGGHHARADKPGTNAPRGIHETSLNRCSEFSSGSRGTFVAMLCSIFA